MWLELKRDIREEARGLSGANDGTSESNSS